MPYAHSQFICSLAGFDLAKCKPGCASDSPAAHFLCSLLVFDETLAQPYFAVVNCSDAMMSVFLSCFNVQPNIFVVMKCCVVALSLFYLRYPNLESWSLIFSSTTHELRGARVEEYANYVNKLRQNVGLKT